MEFDVLFNVFSVSFDNSLYSLMHDAKSGSLLLLSSLIKLYKVDYGIEEENWKINYFLRRDYWGNELILSLQT